MAFQSGVTEFSAQYVGLMALAWFLAGLLAGRRFPVKSKPPKRKQKRSASRSDKRRAEGSSGSDSELYVGNLSYDLREKDIEKTFGEFGRVVDIRLIKHNVSGKSKGYCFVGMGSRREMDKAIAGLNGKELRGRKIVVSEARSRAR